MVMSRNQIALIIFLFSLLVFVFFGLKTYQNMSYFVPLADAVLHGRIDVAASGAMNELVPYAGKWFVVYPPMPAIAVLPFVLIWGIGFNQAIASILFAAVATALFFILTTKFTKKLWVSLALTALFSFGTNFFYTSLIGSSWYIAHILAIFFLICAMLMSINKKPFLSGMFLSFAFLSRLPTILAFPILLYFLLSKGKIRLKTILWFVVPILSAIIIFALYNLLRFGSFTQTGYSLIPGVLQEPWYQEGIFNLSYIPRQLNAIFLVFPKITPDFPYFLPSNIAMALWVTTPALLLLFFVKFKDKALGWFLLTALLVALPSLIHGTVGFTQFGYRFSLDYILFLLLPLIFVFERIGKLWTWIFVSLSVAINLWVVILFYLHIFHT